MSTPASDKPVALRARLTWQDSQGNPLERLLDNEAILIGREKDCDIHVQDEFVSRHHAQINFDGTAYLVADLGSINGTYVNGKRVTAPEALKDGDVLSIRGMEFHFIKPTPPTPPAEKSQAEKTLVAPAPAVTPFLEICSGSGKNVHFDLVKEKMTVGRAGRGQQWDLTLFDRAVSRPQAEITCLEGSYILTDLKSANGTLVNAAEITEPYTLKEGDAITFGETVLVFHAGAVKP